MGEGPERGRVKIGKFSEIDAPKFILSDTDKSILEAPAPKRGTIYVHGITFVWGSLFVDSG